MIFISLHYFIIIWVIVLRSLFIILTIFQFFWSLFFCPSLSSFHHLALERWKGWLKERTEDHKDRNPRLYSCILSCLFVVGKGFPLSGQPTMKDKHTTAANLTSKRLKRTAAIRGSLLWAAVFLPWSRWRSFGRGIYIHNRRVLHLSTPGMKDGCLIPFHTALLKRPVHLIHSSTIQTDSVYLFYLLAAVSRCCDDVRCSRWGEVVEGVYQSFHKSSSIGPVVWALMGGLKPNDLEVIWAVESWWWLKLDPPDNHPGRLICHKL